MVCVFDHECVVAAGNEFDEYLVVLECAFVGCVEYLSAVGLAGRHGCQDGAYEAGFSGPGRSLKYQYGFTRCEVTFDKCGHRFRQSRVGLIIWCRVRHFVERCARETHVSGEKVPVDSEHFAAHHLFADDAEQLRAHSLQTLRAIGPDLEFAGTVVDLASATGADEGSWTVQ